MRTVSREFEKSELKTYPKVVFIFADGRTLTVEDPNLFKISGNAFSDSAGQSSFPLGAAVAKTATVALWNDDDRYNSYDFYKSKFVLHGYKVLESGDTELVLIGNFTVTTPESYGTTVEVTGIDDMYKFDVAYEPTHTFPTSLQSAVRQECTRLNVSLLTTTFKNGDFIIPEKPQNITSRQFIGMAAQLACGNAQFDQFNRLTIKSYDFSPFETTEDLYGGIFDSDTPYNTGDTADGGSFNPWNNGCDCNAGDFTYMDNFHVLYDFKSDPSKSTDDVVITGVQITQNEKTYLSGKEGYILSIENQLANGGEKGVVELIGKSVVGLRFRPFSGEHFSTIIPEFMDLAYVLDRQGNPHRTFLTDVGFVFGGYTTLKCSADDPLRNSSQFESEATKAIVQARMNTEKQINEYDKAVQMLTSIMANSLGMFFTTEKTESGGEIVYQHNQPLLDESNIIWKKTENAFTVSTDGGKTWNAGIDANGNVVVNVLSAIGINFDWARGGELILGGHNNRNGVLKILSENNEEIGKWTKDGVEATSCKFSGSLISRSSDNERAIRVEKADITFLHEGSNTPAGRIGIVDNKILNSVFSENGSFLAVQTPTNIDAVAIGERSSEELFTGRIFVNSGLNPYGYKQNIILNGSTWINDVETSYIQMHKTKTAGDERVRIRYADEFYIISNQFLHGSEIFNGRSLLIDCDYVRVGSDVEQNAALICDKLLCLGTKNRLVHTKNYNYRSLYSYELSYPMFGDIGEGTTDEKGICYIYFDDIFIETVNTGVRYHVFLQKEGQGDLWVEEKDASFFVVKGSPNLKFSWEVKIVQREYELERLETQEEKLTKHDFSYDQEYIDEIEQLINEREKMYYGSDN